MIVILYPQFYGVGGVARYLDSFLSNLPLTAPEIALITGGRAAHAKTYRGVEIINIPTGSSRLGLLLWSWKAMRRIEALQRHRPIEALNLHIPPLIPGLFLSRDIPIVLTAHSTYLGMSQRIDAPQNRRHPWVAWGMWLKSQMDRALITRADTVITLTEQGKDELAAYGRHERIAIIPNGVDLTEFTPGKDADKDIDVVFCGRIERMKGSRALIEVCQQLIAAKPRIRIAIVGYGDDEGHVRQALAPLKDQVLFTGKLPFDKMAGYYRRSRVYASTSYYEGLPGTCLEAMASGLPAVVWDLPFYRGLVQPGITGLTAPVNDTGAMADSIARLLGDAALASAMGAQGGSLVREHYDWRRLAVKLLTAYAQTLKPAVTTAVAP